MKVIKIKGICHIKPPRVCSKNAYCNESVEGYIEKLQTIQSVMCIECEAIFNEKKKENDTSNIYNQSIYKGFEIKRMFPNKYSIRKNNQPLGSNHYYTVKACQNVIDTILRAQKQNEEKIYK